MEKWKLWWEGNEVILEVKDFDEAYLIGEGLAEKSGTHLMGLEQEG